MLLVVDRDEALIALTEWPSPKTRRTSHVLKALGIFGALLAVSAHTAVATAITLADTWPYYLAGIPLALLGFTISVPALRPLADRSERRREHPNWGLTRWLERSAILVAAAALGYWWMVRGIDLWLAWLAALAACGALQWGRSMLAALAVKRVALRDHEARAFWIEQSVIEPRHSPAN